MTGHRHRLAVLRVLAEAGTEDNRPRESGDTSHHVHDRRSREVHVPMAEAEARAEVGEPAPAPHPVAEQGVDEHRHEEAVDEEGRPLPALGHRPRRDRDRGVHEHHLEEEEGEDAHVVDVAAEEEALGAEEVEGLPEERHRVLAGEGSRSSERGHRPHSAHLEGEAADPVPEHADGIDHVVHRERVGGVLRAREARLHHRETRLHEHDEEAGEERPHDVDRDLVVPDGVHHLG
jgi:hypothetical protein